MKIRQLRLENFQQFNQLNLDFTYPNGHEKTGQPLDKICFIGQSGTGKTTLLNLIQNHIKKLDFFYRKKTNLGVSHSELFFNDWNYHQKGVNFSSVFKNIDIGENDLEGIVIKVNNKQQNNLKKLLKIIEAQKSLSLYFPAELIENSAAHLIPKEKAINADKLLSEIDVSNEVAESTINYKIQFREKVIILDKKQSKIIWQFLLQEIKDYNEKLFKKSVEVWKKSDFKDIAKIEKDRIEWNKQNPNPKIPLARNCLNPILAKFNLEVDIDNTDYFVVLKQKNQEDPIPAKGLSTGTKQLILSSIPLYQLDTQDAIILIDEPERSLFPDIQLELVDYYTNLSPTSQFFFATHSPIIAASFEPYERFILSFDEKGKVQIKQGSSPKGDDPNDMLHADFNVSYLNEYGIKMWEKYLSIKRDLANEKDSNKRKTLIKEYRKLGDTYNFEA